MFQLTGTVKVLNDTQQVTDSFKKREFVVTDASSQYPQDILFQAVQANTDKLNDIQVGETVTVSFNLRGREWTSPQGEVKYFNSLDAWNIIKAGAGAPPVQGAPAAPSASPETQLEEGDDDLPF
jgi:hypothetical protein